ncbi:MAG: ACT domain-containing protein [Nocardioides sp.]
MTYLLRVELPDVPGSLGKVASAIGSAGGNIEAIEIVAHRSDGAAVDDVVLDMAPGAMPDSVVSACQALDGVRVLWVSRYAAGANLFLDLEVVEELTRDPAEALERLVAMLPVAFRADWAARLRRGSSGPDGAEVLQRTEAAPSRLAWVDVERAGRLPSADDVTLTCAAPLGADELVVLGREGGPEFLDSELARLGHLVGLAASISAPAVGA